jgi:hypothetical protein
MVAFLASLWVIGSRSLLAASLRSLWQPCWSDGHFSDVLSRIVRSVGGDEPSNRVEN